MRALMRARLRSPHIVGMITATAADVLKSHLCAHDTCRVSCARSPFLSVLSLACCAQPSFLPASPRVVHIFTFTPECPSSFCLRAKPLTPDLTIGCLASFPRMPRLHTHIYIHIFELCIMHVFLLRLPPLSPAAHPSHPLHPLLHVSPPPPVVYCPRYTKKSSTNSST